MGRFKRCTFATSPRLGQNANEQSGIFFHRVVVTLDDDPESVTAHVSIFIRETRRNVAIIRRLAKIQTIAASTSRSAKPNAGSKKIPREGSRFDMATSAKTKIASAKKVVATKAKKPVAKPAVKPTAKKPAPKPAAKPAAKPTPKPVAKPAAKTATKPAAKPVAKVEPKVATKVAPVSDKKVVAPAPAVVAAKPVAAVTPVTSSSNKPVAKTNTVTAPSPPKAVVLSLNAHKKYAGLTEAEIVKQPESEYMSKAQLAFFKEKLTELRGQILHNATDTGEHLRDVEVATDPSDRATQEEEYTLELRTRDRERKLLKKVDKVLRMIDDGSFGWCEETGEPIGIARLIARPTATLSIEAQERRERMQKLFGD
jgi:DnaK suppressor protein